MMAHVHIHTHMYTHTETAFARGACKGHKAMGQNFKDRNAGTGAKNCTDGLKPMCVCACIVQCHVFIYVCVYCVYTYMHVCVSVRAKKMKIRG
jgi:hypothetical protein